jgi:hypothetical protein
LALLNTENLAKARHLKRSTKVKSMHSPFVEMIRTVVRRGVESGDFRVAVDPVQLYISIAALCFFYLSNSATLSVIWGSAGHEARLRQAERWYRDLAAHVCTTASEGVRSGGPGASTGRALEVGRPCCRHRRGAPGNTAGGVERVRAPWCWCACIGRRARQRQSSSRLLGS